jgi:competence protein ComEC
VRPAALPLGAVALGAGVLAGLGRVSPTAGVALLAVAGGLAAAAWPDGRERRSTALLAGAGIPPRLPTGHRERILAAADIPWREAPIPPVRGHAPGAALRLVAALSACALAGAGWAAVRDRPPELGALEGRWTRFAGVAASDVRAFDHGWGLEVSVDLVRTPEPRRVALRVWLSGGGDAPAIEAGQPLEGGGTFRALSGDGFAAYLRGRGVAARVSGDVDSLGPARGLPLRLANAARAGLRRGLEAVLSSREAGLALGLAIGDVSSMDPEVDEDFRATGLGHLLAVSGSNVAMFLAPLLGLVIRAGGGRSARLLVGAVAVGFFALVTRWEPSVLRASAMALIALAGAWSGRPRSTAPALAGAVALLLLADPRLAGSLGFQLSVAATAGLAVLAGPIAERLRWLPRPVALAAAATTAAQAAVTPLLLWRFGVVPIVTLVANVLAAPAVGPALLVGVAAGTAAGPAEPVARLLALPARAGLGYLMEVADRAARLPLPAVAGEGAVLPLAAAAAVVAVGWWVRRSRRGGGGRVVAAGLLVLGWMALPGAGGPRWLTVVFLDVGQGDGAVVRSPGGATILIDAGPEDDAVSAALARLGVRRIDLAVVSHAHADHLEGFPAVLARHPVGLLIEPGCPAESPAYRRLRRAAEDEDVPVRFPRGGDRLRVADVVIDVLGPDGCSLWGEGVNDDSLVLRITAGGATVLFTGDAEVPAQEDLLADGDPVAADVLKVPHHGGATSAPEFFRAVGARLAVVSTGSNDYGHPHPETLRSLRRLGTVVARTDLEGDVTVTFEGDRVLLGGG